MINPTQDAGSNWMREPALLSLMDGVMAAPAGRDPRAWLSLVKPRTLVRSKCDQDALLTWYDSYKSSKAQLAVAMTAAERIAALRAQMVAAEVDGFIVPSADEYQCEYTPESAKRLKWLTGFSGSAGTAVVLADKAAVISDGRYTLQLANQTDPAIYSTSTDIQVHDWIATNLQAGGKLGYDPWLFTPAQRDKLKVAVTRAGGQLVACKNLVDAVWNNKPASPISPIVAHPLEYAGKSATDKLAELTAKLQKEKLDAVVLTSPDSVAWLLNIRGGDVACTPLTLCFAIVHASGKVELFTDPRKLTRGIRKHLGKNVKVQPRESLPAALDRLAKKELRVQVDPASSACFIIDRLRVAGANLTHAADPCKLPKACKNDGELAGARACHIRDGAALTRFLFWAKVNCASGKFTELDAQKVLQDLRAEVPMYQDLSFSTIMGTGAHGAIVHYGSKPETNIAIEAGNLLLADSGVQYQDGTTDVTRTMAIGTPTHEMRDRFTRVLKGHIALAKAEFPTGTAGDNLDVLARMFLWQAGLDYAHGTGHGVGSYLGVHEGPQSIRSGNNATALKPGMIISNEPGYYKAGEYGIRIENLIVVVERPAIAGGEEKMLGFETITLAPIDLDLVDVALMTHDEIAWLNAYHTEVREKLTPLLDKETAAWLAEATRPLHAGCALLSSHLSA